MSRRVKERLDALRILTEHIERVEIDKIVEEKTGKYCDEGIDDVSDEQLKDIVEEARRRLRKKKEKRVVPAII